MNVAHIRQEGLRRFACRCGGRFDAPKVADAAKVRDAANAWAALHEACAPFVPRNVAPPVGPSIAKVR